MSALKFRWFRPFCRISSTLLVLQVLENMARVDRVLTMPGGSLLMAGRSGVGRRTAISVVANMHQMSVFSPKIGRGYTSKHFKTDLKTVQVVCS